MSSSPPPAAPATPGDGVRRVWTFDDFTLDVARYELRQGGTVIRVEPQVFDVLVLLVRNHDRFVAKGRFERRMAELPVLLITHPQPGLFGAAAAFAGRFG